MGAVCRWSKAWPGPKNPEGTVECGSESSKRGQKIEDTKLQTLMANAEKFLGHVGEMQGFAEFCCEFFS